MQRCLAKRAYPNYFREAWLPPRKMSGSLSPEKEIHPYWKILLAPGQNTLYFKVQSRTPLRIPLAFLSDDQCEERVVLFYFLSASILAISLSFAFYHLVLYFSDYFVCRRNCCPN